MLGRSVVWITGMRKPGNTWVGELAVLLNGSVVILASLGLLLFDTVENIVAKWKLLINPFPHMTNLQQTTLNIFCQKIENLHN